MSIIRQTTGDPEPMRSALVPELILDRKLIKHAGKAIGHAELQAINIELKSRLGQMKLERLNELVMASMQHMQRHAEVDIHAKRVLGKALLEAVGDCGSVTADSLMRTLADYDKFSSAVMHKLAEGVLRLVSEASR